MKSLRTLALAMFVVVIAASLAIFCITLEAHSFAGDKWIVIFNFKPKPAHEVQDPDIRIYVVVDAKTEGDAAINAHKALSEKLTTHSAERLNYLEAQMRK